MRLLCTVAPPRFFMTNMPPLSDTTLVMVGRAVFSDTSTPPKADEPVRVTAPPLDSLV